MSYDVQKSKMGNVPVYIVELELDKCSRTYGVLPCTASGAVGTECFNTFGTCQDTANYDKTTKTIRFSSVRIDNIQDVGEAPTFPTVIGISTAPTRLTPAKGFGIRSTVTVQLQDHPWTDAGIDPYVSTRTYEPDARGSFWGKFMARERYYEGRPITIRTGYLADDGTYDASNFIERTYFIDTIKGPDKSGKVTITGKDALRFADNSKAQLPEQSEAELDADITDSATSFDITDPSDNIKDAYDDANNVSAGQCYIRVDDEVMLVTNLTGTNPDYTLTVTRATMPSRYSGSMVAESHSEGSTVQHCYEFSNAQIDDILFYLLNTVAGIDASYLPTTDWQSIIDFGLTSYLFSTLLTEPTGVKDLIEELTQHSIFVWWNERDQEVQMRSIISQDVDHGPFDDSSNIVADSVSTQKVDGQRASQVWLIYGHRNPVFELNKFNYFDSVKISVDPNLEGANAYDQKKVLKIWSRWLSTDQKSIASEITNRLNAEYKNTKTQVSVAMTPKDDDVWTGDIITLSTRQVQDQFGDTPNYTYRVLEARENLKAGNVAYKYVMESVGDEAIDGGVNTGLIGPNTLLDYGSESQANKDTYAFIASDDRGDGNAGFAPDEPPYYIV